MQLKEISINNFGSFIGRNEIRFGPTLTLFIGDNGDGKTTFFDALKWVLDTTNSEPPIPRLSEKVGRELKDGDEAECSVGLVFVHKGNRFNLKKSFFVRAEGGNLIFPNSVSHIVYIENSSGERIQGDAKKVIEEIFDTSIQSFCLFKGETELNVLNNQKSLGKLLSKLSDISQFDSYKVRANKLEADASRAFARELRGHKDTAKKTEEIQERLTELGEKKKSLKSSIEEMRREIKDSQDIYNELQKNRRVWAQYRDLEKDKKKIIDEIVHLESETKVNPNIKLLDDLWVLRNYGPVFNEFKDKVAFWRDQRQKLQNERMREEERNKTEAELGARIRTLLPIQVPDESTMEALIKAEKCEICGREAKKGTPAYEHMCQRLAALKEYLSGLKKEAPVLPPLFVSNYISEINGLYRKLTGETQAELNSAMNKIEPTLLKLARDKKKLSEQREELESIETDIKNLLIANQIDDEQIFFGATQRQFNESIQNMGRAQGREQQLEEDLKTCYSEILGLDEELRKLGQNKPEVSFLSHVKDVLSQIALAFEQGREKNADEFVTKLQERSNYFLENLCGNDFRGYIRLLRNQENDEISIRLEDTSGREIALPNAALKTSQYLAVLFAISDLTSDKNKESYPLVFDAPTSSFSLGREEEFYNTVEGLDKQCIILTKDLLLQDGELDMKRISQLNCKVFRLKKAPNFVQGDLSTIRTQVIEM